MARKLVNYCLVWTLLLGCWGGALAATVCPHVGCEPASAATEPSATHDHHADAEVYESAGVEDHSAHAGAHQGQAPEPSAGEQVRPKAEGLRGLVSSPHDTFCLHCVGGSQAPPTTKFEWQFNPTMKVEKDSAIQVVRPLPANARAFVPEITPAQHAPPGWSDRHLLLSVFRI